MEGGGVVKREKMAIKPENPKNASLCKTAAVTVEETRGNVVSFSSKDILRDTQRFHSGFRENRR